MKNVFLFVNFLFSSSVNKKFLNAFIVMYEKKRSAKETKVNENVTEKKKGRERERKWEWENQSDSLSTNKSNSLKDVEKKIQSNL